MMSGTGTGNGNGNGVGAGDFTPPAQVVTDPDGTIRIKSNMDNSFHSTNNEGSDFTAAFNIVGDPKIGHI